MQSSAIRMWTTSVSPLVYSCPQASELWPYPCDMKQNQVNPQMHLSRHYIEVTVWNDPSGNPKQICLGHLWDLMGRLGPGRVLKWSWATWLHPDSIWTHIQPYGPISNRCAWFWWIHTDPKSVFFKNSGSPTLATLMVIWQLYKEQIRNGITNDPNLSWKHNHFWPDYMFSNYWKPGPRGVHWFHILPANMSGGPCSQDPGRLVLVLLDTKNAASFISGIQVTDRIF